MPEGSVLLAANHSGYGVMEIFLLLTVWTRRFGLARPAAGLSHDVGFTWPIRWCVERIGGVRASRDVARELLARGLPVLVFPGGDHDVFRTFRQRDEVVWGGRSGFVQTAADAGVPLVPLAISGSHAQYTILPGGEALARLFGAKRFRLRSLPPWLGLVGFLVVLGLVLARLLPVWSLPLAFLVAVLPNPTSIEIRALPAMDPRALLRSNGGDARAAGEAVRVQIADAVAGMASRRRLPWG